MSTRTIRAYRYARTSSDNIHSQTDMQRQKSFAVLHQISISPSIEPSRREPPTARRQLRVEPLEGRSTVLARSADPVSLLLQFTTSAQQGLPHFLAQADPQCAVFQPLEMVICLGSRLCRCLHCLFWYTCLRLAIFALPTSPLA